MDLQTSISSALAWGPVPTSATLADWERLMRRAGAALHMQQWRMALGYQRQALAVALGIAHHPPAGREDDCVAALVVSHLNLAELSQEAAAPTESARLLCQAHATLLRRQPCSRSQAGSCSSMSAVSSTGMPNTKDVPKSPRSSRPRNARYCRHSGRSSPRWRIACARMSCVASGEINTSIGLPIA